MKWKTERGGGRTVHTAICARCEKPFEDCTSNAQHYCKECAAIVKREKTAARVRAYRERMRADAE